MKSQLAFALWAAAANAQTAGPRGPSDVNLGNLISTLTGVYNEISKTIQDAAKDFRSGTPFPVVFDQTLPKIVPEAKLFERTVMKPVKQIRAGSVTAKAAFGPYVLAGKNVSASHCSHHYYCIVSHN
jgi:hypothetical protein